jgi:ubiquinone/menaquinone biosynthesis C-methylase UbiE
MTPEDQRDMVMASVSARFSRLRLQASIFDHVTIRHLETIGVAEGWKCLEVGAGTGSIAQWLSNRVGPTGRVVATDIDTRFLQRMTASNLEVRRHDILKEDLEKGAYDLVMCRKLLHNLLEPERALKHMADAVRPGGWLLAEEDDWGSALSWDVTEPSAAQHIAVTRALFDDLRKRRIIDQYFGRRVRGLVEGLGFVDVGQEGWTQMVRGGDPLARVLAASGRAMLSTGLFTKEQYDSFMRVWLDPSVVSLAQTLFSAWGRKPVSQGGGTTS